MFIIATDNVYNHVLWLGYIFHTTVRHWCDLLFYILQELAIMTMKSSKNIIIKSFTKQQQTHKKLPQIIKGIRERVLFKNRDKISQHMFWVIIFLCVNWPLDSTQKNKAEKLYEDVNYIMIHERGFAHNHIPKATISLKYQAKKKCAPYVIMLTTEMFLFLYIHKNMFPFEWMNFTVMILGFLCLFLWVSFFPRI